MLVFVYMVGVSSKVLMLSKESLKNGLAKNTKLINAPRKVVRADNYKQKPKHAYIINEWFLIQHTANVFFYLL